MTTSVAKKSSALLAMILVAGTGLFGGGAKAQNLDLNPQPVETASLAVNASAPAQTLSTPNRDGLSSLSPSNRAIAQALFAAQDDADRAWSLDRIVAVRLAGFGWGRIFRAMKKDGAVTAATLGEAIDGVQASASGRRAQTLHADTRVAVGFGQAVLVRQGVATSGVGRPSAAMTFNKTVLPARIDLGRVVVSDFDRRGASRKGHHARLVSAVRIYRD